MLFYIILCDIIVFYVVNKGIYEYLDDVTNGEADAGLLTRI